MRLLSRTVWILSLVSLFTDLASEMLYPVMPLYLRHIGFGVLLIGILEGVAEATAGLSKGWFGLRSDQLQRRLPFVQWGYLLSALSKPMLALSGAVWWVFAARTTDRLGKGLRTGARDALLNAACTPATKGRVFGFHRSMDTLGAVLGPVVALLYLHFNPERYVTLFLIAFVPGLLAIVLTRMLKEPPAAPTKAPWTGFFAFLRYWKQAPHVYRRLTTGLLLFALFNSSDVFLLLGAKQAGLSDTGTIGVYIFYNLVYALFAFPLGALADRIGVKRVFLIGLALFAAVYFGMAAAHGPLMVALLFLLYGLYAASTEGIAKAWIGHVVKPEEMASASGTYAGLQSLCALGASSLAGALWFAFGPAVTFTVTAVMALATALYMGLVVPPPAR
jgi:MFS family permease